MIWVSYPKLFDFGFGYLGFHAQIFGFFGVNMKPIPKTQTQIFLGVNVWPRFKKIPTKSIIHYFSNNLCLIIGLRTHLAELQIKITDIVAFNSSINF